MRFQLPFRRNSSVQNYAARQVGSNTRGPTLPSRSRTGRNRNRQIQFIGASLVAAFLLASTFTLGGVVSFAEQSEGDPSLPDKSYIGQFRTAAGDLATGAASGEVVGAAVQEGEPDNTAPMQPATASVKSGTLFEELKTFADVLSIVQEDYVRPVDNRKVVEGAIRGMLTTLDPHSGYLDPDFYKDLQSQTKGEFGGLGIEINVKDGVLVVVSPMEGSPAAIAGIKPGDAIVKIDGRFTKEMPLVEAVKRLRGSKGTSVRISVARRGVAKLLEYELVRDTIQVKSVKHRLLNNGLGYVRITQFAEKTSDDLRASLKQLTERSPGATLRGIILDLRNNPGGLLNQAVEVADLFLREGVIVYTDGRDSAQRHNFYAHERGTEPDYPIVVLVNGGSASAAEIVSGSFQDAARGIIVGTQTFGKGSVQTIMPLANGGAVTLTTALYYTKSGRSIQVTGVHPDVVVEALDVSPVDGPTSGKSVIPGSAGRKIGEPLLKEGDLPGAIANPTEPPSTSANRSTHDGISSSGIPPLTSDHSESANDESVEDAGASGQQPMKQINRIDGEDLRPIDIESISIEDWNRRDPQFAKALEILERDAVRSH